MTEASPAPKVHREKDTSKTHKDHRGDRTPVPSMPEDLPKIPRLFVNGRKQSGRKAHVIAYIARAGQTETTCCRLHDVQEIESPCWGAQGLGGEGLVPYSEDRRRSRDP